MVEIKELVIKTSIEPRRQKSPINKPTQVDSYQIKKEIIEESLEHFSKILKNKKER